MQNRSGRSQKTPEGLGDEARTPFRVAYVDATNDAAYLAPLDRLSARGDLTLLLLAACSSRLSRLRKIRPRYDLDNVVEQ
jgi:hypothetical protein